MFDPTRIDRTLRALRDAWEGQPELPLGTIFAMLANQGLGWGADDEELRAALESMARVHPPTLPLDDARVTRGLWLIVTESNRVTVDADRVIVRTTSKAGPGQPVSWKYSAIRAVGPGRPLAVTDAEGFEHRYGVVELITQLTPDYRSLEGLKRRSVGERVWMLRTSDEVIVLDHGLHVYTSANRGCGPYRLFVDSDRAMYCGRAAARGLVSWHDA
ncbi:hypothetical protein [Corynebacterium striatum]|uniref:hypothetical protein n=1 Tax=Corynebacterium striatum TaxID=43770 RepID=UPI0034D6DD27